LTRAVSGPISCCLGTISQQNGRPGKILKDDLIPFLNLTSRDTVAKGNRLWREVTEQTGVRAGKKSDSPEFWPCTEPHPPKETWSPKVYSGVGGCDPKERRLRDCDHYQAQMAHPCPSKIPKVQSQGCRGGSQEKPHTPFMQPPRERAESALGAMPAGLCSLSPSRVRKPETEER
jgi:hypothetical protein